MIEQNSNRKNFIFGLVAGIAIISTIGFVVLLATGYGGNEKGNNKTDTNQVAQKPNNNTPPAQQAGKITVNSNDHIRGDKNAPITLVEFSDFQCPYCKRFHPTMQQVMENYQGQVRWIYRHFPLDFHQNAQKSAEAAECAGEQGKFWEYIDKAFENSQADGTGLNAEDLKKYAQELGLNTGKFNDCFANGKFTSKVKADMDSGQTAGVTGTPGTILIDKNGNAELISGALPYEQIKAKIDSVLK
ncbi:MAG: DsbA family protein [bacterium]|nr:DsbA family protein [bacterium]